jgi:hypothetical protein
MMPTSQDLSRLHPNENLAKYDSFSIISTWRRDRSYETQPRLGHLKSSSSGDLYPLIREEGWHYVLIGPKREREKTVSRSGYT